ncbi:MAG: oligoendopeptidase F [Chloroflexota bacterium]
MHRSEIPVEYTWDLTLMFADDAAWERAVNELESTRSEITTLVGTVARDAHSLVHALGVRDRVMMKAQSINHYARMRKDSDGTDTVAQALESRAGSMVAQIGAVLSFLEPEILAIPEETLSRWQREERDLAPYAYYLERLTRLRAHTRSAEVEEVLAEFSDITRAAGDSYEALTNVDLQFPTIEDADGRRIEVSPSRYFMLMRSPDRRVRRDAFKALFGILGSVRTTLASTLGATIRSHVIEARLRTYPSALAASLEPNDIPLQVYHNLISTVHANLPRFHRYLDIRKRILGVDDLHAYDIYAPLVPDVDEVIQFEEGKRMMREAFVPLGEDYKRGLDEILSNRWIDVYENIGKQSGAYSGGTYTSPPYILLNYQDRFEDVTTLAHELGHSLHTYFTHKKQAFISADYTLFVAEVASTLNEALLTGHLLGTTDDPAMRKYLIVDQLEAYRSTLFRQVMFAEYELAMHEAVEGGNALTSDWLSERYRSVAAKYYGPVLAIDDELGMEWAFIPHFYYNFYVYQYATGMSAALALAAQIREEGAPAVQRYLTFLSSGSSRPSIELLKDAGVDMVTPAPIQQSMDQFERLLDELESLSP